MVNEAHLLPQIDSSVGIDGQYLDDINAYVGNIFATGLIFRVFTQPRPVSDVTVFMPDRA